MGILQQLRQKIINRDYYLTSHAEEEMWADGLERFDVENALLKGRIEKKLTRDPRGLRYRVEGPALDGRAVQVVCRLDQENRLRILTVYARD